MGVNEGWKTEELWFCKGMMGYVKFGSWSCFRYNATANLVDPYGLIFVCEASGPRKQNAAESLGSIPILIPNSASWLWCTYSRIGVPIAKKRNSLRARTFARLKCLPQRKLSYVYPAKGVESSRNEACRPRSSSLYTSRCSLCCGSGPILGVVPKEHGQRVHF